MKTRRMIVIGVVLDFLFFASLLYLATYRVSSDPNGNRYILLALYFMIAVYTAKTIAARRNYGKFTAVIVGTKGEIDTRITYNVSGVVAEALYNNIIISLFMPKSTVVSRKSVIVADCEGAVSIFSHEIQGVDAINFAIDNEKDKDRKKILVSALYTVTRRMEYTSAQLDERKRSGGDN